MRFPILRVLVWPCHPVVVVQRMSSLQVCVLVLDAIVLFYFHWFWNCLQRIFAPDHKWYFCFFLSTIHTNRCCHGHFFSGRSAAFNADWSRHCHLLAIATFSRPVFFRKCIQHMSENQLQWVAGSRRHRPSSQWWDRACIVSIPHHPKNSESQCTMDVPAYPSPSKRKCPGQHSESSNNQLSYTAAERLFQRGSLSPNILLTTFSSILKNLAP